MLWAGWAVSNFASRLRSSTHPISYAYRRRHSGEQPPSHASTDEAAWAGLSTIPTMSEEN